MSSAIPWTVCRVRFLLQRCRLQSRLGFQIVRFLTIIIMAPIVIIPIERALWNSQINPDFNVAMNVAIVNSRVFIKNLI